MLTERLHFEWVVSRDGYDWDNGVLWDCGHSQRLRHYAPLRVPGLFLTFAETRLTHGDIRRFANQYGVLGASNEPFALWVREIWTLRQTLRLWEAANRREKHWLSRYIQWDRGNAVRYRVPRNTVPLAVHEAGAALDRVIASRKDEDSAFLELRPGDVIQPAKLFVQETVNKYLSREVSPLLLRDEKFALEVCFVPKTLLGGLWLQFADAIDKNVTYRRCQQCGTPFAVGAGTARRTKLFCSDACKSLHYRQRQATARSLHAEGRSLADIARRLNTDTETVRGWIEKGQ